jgi:hypothetical protein
VAPFSYALILRKPRETQQLRATNGERDGANGAARRFGVNYRKRAA